MAINHPPPPPHPYPHSSGPSTVPFNKAPRPYGGCGSENEYLPSQSPFAAFIPSPSSAFTPASSYTNLPPPPPPVSYPSSSSSSSSPPVLVPPQPSVYNTPINLYSSENACEVAMGQRRGLLESQGGALPMQFNGWVAVLLDNQINQFLVLSPFPTFPVLVLSKVWNESFLMCKTSSIYFFLAATFGNIRYCARWLSVDTFLTDSQKGIMK